MTRDGSPMQVAFSTINRKLAFLRKLLRLAMFDGIIKSCPVFKGLIEGEDGRQRERIISSEEFASILANMKRPVQRVCICLNETGMRREEAIRLTWDKVSEKDGFIKLEAEDTKSRKPRSVPISVTLMKVFRELREEQKKIHNDLNRVLTRNGKPIKSMRGAWELATEKADVEMQTSMICDTRLVRETYWMEFHLPPSWHRWGTLHCKCKSDIPTRKNTT